MLKMLTWWLVIIGGINWGLVGLLDLNLVNMIFSGVPGLENIIYVLVGASAVYLLLTMKSMKNGK